MKPTNDECPGCGEDVLCVDAIQNGNRIRLMLQPGELEIIYDVQDGVPLKVRGYQRHWKFCERRPATGAESAPPPSDSAEQLP